MNKQASKVRSGERQDKLNFPAAKNVQGFFISRNILRAQNLYKYLLILLKLFSPR